jgi:hypothetical protein
MDNVIRSPGPCLSNASYSFVSSDDKISARVTVSGGRTDDFVKMFFHLRYDVLQPMAFSRWS